MKCGTSTLHEQLASRRRFFMSTPKEPNFFSDDAAYHRGMTAYEALFTAALPSQIVGESSTHYTKLPTFDGVADRIFEHTPHARLIYVVRDPMARLVSQYVHEWSNIEVREPIDEAVRIHERFVAYSCYYRQLEPFLARFGPERIALVFFEKMIADPVSELERVARFVGDDAEEPFVWHEEIARQNVGADRLRKSALREGFKATKAGAFLKRVLPPSLKDSLKSFWKMKKRPELSSEVEAELREIIDADLAKFGRLIDLELTSRNFRDVARGTVPVLRSDAAQLVLRGR